jgi:radical SAM protein with 4Fe4S-binding SPASM domain
MHPKFRQILEYLNNYSLKKYFVTNGMLLDKFSDDIFNFNVDIIAISLDGASPETNNRIRVKGDFTKVITNIKKIVKRRDELKVPYPYMNFVMTLMKENIEELPQMVKLAHDIGIEEVKAVYLTAFNQEMSKSVLFNEVDNVRRIFSETNALGEKYNIKIKLPYIQGEDIAKDAYHKTCYVVWRDFFLGSDGYVRPCQSTSMKLFHFNKYQNFDEMWNSIEYQDFRKRVNSHEDMPLECKACYQSSHANWNRKSSFVQMETGVDFAPKWEREKEIEHTVVLKSGEGVGAQ